MRVRLKPDLLGLGGFGVIIFAAVVVLILAALIAGALAVVVVTLAGLGRLLFGAVAEPRFADGLFERLLDRLGRDVAVHVMDFHRRLGSGFVVQFADHAN